MKITELGKSSTYRKPIGMMEMYKFMQIATPEQKAQMRGLIGIVKGEDELRAKKAEQNAWELLQNVTSTALSESDSELNEYKIIPFHTQRAKALLDHGDETKHDLITVNTPLSDKFLVKYDEDGYFHDYYLYDKDTEKCVGLFSLEEITEETQNKFSDVLKSGTKIVIPHIVLHDSIRGRGLGFKIYTTFLKKDPWVFITDKHSAAAQRLWDILLQTGNFVDVYYNLDNKEIVKKDSIYINLPNTYRIIGVRSRFK